MYEHMCSRAAVRSAPYVVFLVTHSYHHPSSLEIMKDVQ